MMTMLDLVLFIALHALFITYASSRIICTRATTDMNIDWSNIGFIFREGIKPLLLSYLHN
jgi:hypothetical protein